MLKKFYIKTFGCQMNEYDSDKMADVLRVSERMTRTDVPEEADLILFNTCSVREKAQEKVFSDLGRVRLLKVTKPDLLIGVGGCVASQEGAAIVKRAPYVDMVFGPQTLHRLPQLMAARRTSGNPQVDISFPEIEKFDHLPEVAPGKINGRASVASAFVSIMEGCSKYCSFCVVPYTRGEEVSRPVADVMRDVQTLVAQGVGEITLLGQNVNAYSGVLTGDNRSVDRQNINSRDDGRVDLAYLIQSLASMKGLQRLRFTTSHPKDMSQRLIDVYAGTPKLSSHLHLPVQSGSDRILAAMKRGHTVLEYKSTIKKLRQVRPDLVVSSDFIVGFPGETERDFEATLQLIKDVGYDSGYSFLYSPRPGTPAAQLKDEVSQETKEARLQRLQDLLGAQSQTLTRGLLGSVQRVLVESVSRKNVHEMAGRLDNNRVVNFAGSSGMIGRFVDVKITGAWHYTLRGEHVM
ncbi:MAG: tRNA (N6-isopentenyl adenosine(37)-C2)-methylthiotransferase MiaB [Candidatus Nitrotoga sp.]